MILVFALAGIFTATVAAVTALFMGQPWWIGLASYIGTGMLTVFAVAIFTAFSLKAGARKTGAAAVGVQMPLAEH